jgi:hypothetical protein
MIPKGYDYFAVWKRAPGTTKRKPGRLSFQGHYVARDERHALKIARQQGLSVRTSHAVRVGIGGYAAALAGCREFNVKGVRFQAELIQS